MIEQTEQRALRNNALKHKEQLVQAHLIQIEQVRQEHKDLLLLRLTEVAKELKLPAREKAVALQEAAEQLKATTELSDLEIAMVPEVLEVTIFKMIFLVG